MSKTNKITNISVVAFFIIVIACISIYSASRFAEYRKMQAQTALKIDSLERSITRWELYSENLRRTLQGQTPVDIDSLMLRNTKDYDQKNQD